jgi:hypothetical protein
MHCRFEFKAPADLVAWDCNCSICNMKRNTHVIVPAAAFNLLQGAAELSCYQVGASPLAAQSRCVAAACNPPRRCRVCCRHPQFGTKQARHLFCRTCGICCHYQPRSNPNGVAITVHCIDPGTVSSVQARQFDGQHWEQAYASTGIAQATAQAQAPPL